MAGPEGGVWRVGRALPPGRPRLARDQGADVEFPARPGAPPAAPPPGRALRFRPLSLRPHPRPPRACPAPHGGRRAPGGRAGAAPGSRGAAAAVAAAAAAATAVAAAALAAARPRCAPGAEPARPQRMPCARVGARPGWGRGPRGTLGGRGRLAFRGGSTRDLPTPKVPAPSATPPDACCAPGRGWSPATTEHQMVYPGPGVSRGENRVQWTPRGGDTRCTRFQT